jgi:hypothetical protein
MGLECQRKGLSPYFAANGFYSKERDDVDFLKKSEVFLTLS